MKKTSSILPTLDRKESSSSIYLAIQSLNTVLYNLSIRYSILNENSDYCGSAPLFQERPPIVSQLYSSFTAASISSELFEAAAVACCLLSC